MRTADPSADGCRSAAIFATLEQPSAGEGHIVSPPPPPPGRYLVLVSLCLLISAPPNKGDPRRMTVPAAGAEGAALSKMITRLHSDTLYRVSVMAVTGAGSGAALFVDGRTRPAARQLHLSLYILYIFSIRFVHGSVFMFPMAGHSVLRIWTGLGVLPPYNPRMVTRELYLQRNRATSEHRGQCSNASRRGSSSSYQPRPACGRRSCGWACVQRQQLWCLRRQGTSLCWGACPIVVPRHSDRSTAWRLANSTRCGCAAAAD